jgi:site-specific DNA-methyltransferase (adenine-specific)
VIRPYYEDEHVVLYCADFREILNEVVERHGTPDLALVDPPYGETSLAWDRWPDGWPALIPGRSMWCFGSMRMFLERRDEFAGWKLSQDVVWEKQDGSGFATDRLRRVHEHALHYYRGRWDDVHHETPRLGRQGRDKSVRRAAVPKGTHGDRGVSVYVDDGRRLLRSVIYSPNMHGKAINETEKPAGLVENLLTYGCPRPGLVLDVFAGSCSTLVAARNSGRRAVGIELREEQCARTVERRLSWPVLLFDGTAPNDVEAESPDLFDEEKI